MTIIYIEGNRVIPGVYIGWEPWKARFVVSEGKGLLNGQLGHITFGLQSTGYNYRHHHEWVERSKHSGL